MNIAVCVKEVPSATSAKRLGVANVFTPGAPTSEIVEFVRGKVAVA